MRKALLDRLRPAQTLKTATLSCAFVILLVVSLSSAWCAPKISPGPVDSSISVQSVTFQPIGSGKNVVHVSIRNESASQKIFVIHLETHVNTGDAIGWERQYTATIKAGETRKINCAFSFVAAVEKGSLIRLRFYEPISTGSCDDNQYFQQQVFSLSDLKLKAPLRLKPVLKSDMRAVQAKRAFSSFQQLNRQERYGEIWDSIFSRDYRDAAFQSLDTFKGAMTGSDSACLSYWDRDTLLAMHPASVKSSSNLTILSVTNGKETWHVNFTHSKSGWRIDWISGFEPVILHSPDPNKAFELLLAKTQTFNTQHFEIHYYKNSTAERELNSIAQAREQGYTQTLETLGLSGMPTDRKIMLFLFEDMKRKFLDTGHPGLGMANKYIMLEVYNKKLRLDPYHEVTHSLMGAYGNPPAVLEEGVAVYMSERLGAPALRELGGGNKKIYTRACDFKQKGEWISLEQLLSYTNIGSQGSRTNLAYTEAGAFVKFLIETFGKDKFLEAYKNLQIPADPEVDHQNQQELERIYGCPLQKLESDWEQAFWANDH